MKRLKVLLLLLFVATTLSAQTKGVQKEYGDDYVKITKIVPKWDNKHDLRVGIGSFSLVTDLFMSSFKLPWVEYYVSYEPKYHLNDRVHYADTYLTNAYYTGVITLSYAYQPRSWFQFGCMATFSAVTQSRRDVVTNKKSDDYSQYCGSILPTARFIYFNHPIVQLYSSISLGVVFCDDDMVIPWADLALVGCTVGKKLFGYAEIGAGVCGWGRIGIGYRFESNKK